MGNVIAVAQQKGGSGKTMLTARFAAALAGQARVAVLDVDPQGSLTAWGRLRSQAPKAAGAFRSSATVAVMTTKATTFGTTIVRFELATP